MMKITRLGLIGDVHAEDENLEVVLHFMHAVGVEQILCVGDIVDGVGSAEKCCHLLQQFQVVTVRGNHDRWLLQNQMRDLPNATNWKELSADSKLFLQALPTTQDFETVSGNLLLCHGLSENDMQRLMPDDYGYALECKDELQTLIRERHFRFVVCGHTHHRMVRQFGNLTVINAGTLYRSHEPCFAIADFANHVVCFYDIENGFTKSESQTIKLINH